MPQVSVVMSVYDQVDPCILGKAVSSILGQTFRDFEFIITADGELTLRQREVLENAAKFDSRIKLLQNERRMGPGYTANRGISLSNSDFIARMDADDISLPERLEQQARFLQEHEDIDVVGTFAYEIDEQDRVLFIKRLPVRSEKLRLFLAKRDPFIHSSVMFRKRFFERVGMYNANLLVNEDTELECRALAAGIAGANIDKFLFMFRRDRQFFKRRRGYRYALQEAKLRWNYIRRSGMPLYYYVYPLLTFSMRMTPECILRGLYKVAR